MWCLAAMVNLPWRRKRRRAELSVMVTSWVEEGVVFRAELKSSAGVELQGLSYNNLRLWFVIELKISMLFSINVLTWLIFTSAKVRMIWCSAMFKFQKHNQTVRYGKWYEFVYNWGSPHWWTHSRCILPCLCKYRWQHLNTWLPLLAAQGKEEATVSNKSPELSLVFVGY